MVLISYCYIHPLYKKIPKMFYFVKRVCIVISESEACCLFGFKTLVELSGTHFGTHFTSDDEVKDNIKFCSIQLNPWKCLTDFEAEIYHSFRFIISRCI